MHVLVSGRKNKDFYIKLFMRCNPRYWFETLKTGSDFASDDDDDDDDASSDDGKDCKEPVPKKHGSHASSVVSGGNRIKVKHPSPYLRIQCPHPLLCTQAP